MSLLGTWEGPGWVPGVSTLYQILLSIQTLIFNQWPRENEPGHERPSDDVTVLHAHMLQSAVYNMEVRLATLTHGITGMIRASPPFFVDAARTHFSFKKRELAAQAVLWAEEALLLARYQLDALSSAEANPHHKCACRALARARLATAAVTPLPPFPAQTPQTCP